MEIKKVINEFKAGISKVYGKKLKGIILYGSWARGDATENSDIDLVVILDGNINSGQEIDHMIDVITDLNLKHDVLLSIYPVSEANYLTLNSPLLLNIRKEGIAA